VTEAKLDLLGGFEKRELRWRATLLRYFVGGEGPPLALVHGFAGAATNFARARTAARRAPSPRDSRLPGHGRSTALPAAPNLAGYADRVAAVLEHEGAVPAAVVGHSMGGVVALRLAARRPELVPACSACSAGLSTSTRTLLLPAAISLLHPAGGPGAGGPGSRAARAKC